jgi:hypothetical protein
MTVTVAKLDHLAKLERRIHMEQRKGHWRWGECFACKPDHDLRVFADGIQHDRIFEFSSDFTDDVNTL